MKLIRILKAKLRNKNKLKKENWYKNRLDTCAACPFNSRNTEEGKNIKYKFWRVMNIGRDFCTICGCEIKAKASEPLEECSAEPKKWEAII
jgi:hypothetical protein